MEPAPPPSLSAPTVLAVGGDGTIYVADTTNGTIRMGTSDQAPIASNGTATTTVGQSVALILPASRMPTATRSPIP